MQSACQPMASIKIYLFFPKKPIRRVLKNRPDIWLPGKTCDNIGLSPVGKFKTTFCIIWRSVE